MNGFMKMLTGLLGIVAICACIATVGIIGYAFVSGGNNPNSNQINASNNNLNQDVLIEVSTPDITPTASPSADPEVTEVPVAIEASHIHDYIPTVIKKATCYDSGQIKYQCACGDYYNVDQFATGHVPGDWEMQTIATENQDGLRVRRCIYCDEIIAQETIPATGGSDGVNSPNGKDKHSHSYFATVEKEPTCTSAGIRKQTCLCGDYYIESIPAVGHIPGDWDEAEKATVNSFGATQKLCTKCGALLDVKVLLPLTPSPAPTVTPTATNAPSGSASGSASPSSSAAKTSPSASPSTAPTPTPHVHVYKEYIMTPSTCTEKGVKSYICGCGSSYSENIELDLENHKYETTLVQPTETEPGYMLFRCERCNHTYKDGYVPSLSGVMPTQAPANK